MRICWGHTVVVSSEGGLGGGAGQILVKAKDIGTLLTRELIGQFSAKRDVSMLTRRDLVELFDLVEKSGTPGTAADLKMRASTFFNWAVGQDLVSANVLGGLRRPRATRSER